MDLKSKKLFGIFNIIDIVIIGVILIALASIFVIKKGAISTTGELIQNREPIEFDVLLEGEKISAKEEIFIPGQQTFITIRNVPYTKLDIISVKKKPWPKDEPNAEYTFNYLITIADKAVITEDGPVVGGNKIKIGLPVTLEGHKYKLNGIVSDLRVQGH